MCINTHRLNSQKFQVNGLRKKQFGNGAGRIKEREDGKKRVREGYRMNNVVLHTKTAFLEEADKVSSRENQI